MTIPAFPRFRGRRGHASQQVGQSSIISQAPHTTLDIDKEGEQNNHNIITRRSVPHQLGRQSSTMLSKLILFLLSTRQLIIQSMLLNCCWLPSVQCLRNFYQLFLPSLISVVASCPYTYEDNCPVNLKHTLLGTSIHARFTWKT